MSDEAELLEHRCPRCHAPIGEPCRTPGRILVKRGHNARRTLAGLRTGRHPARWCETCQRHHDGRVGGYRGQHKPPRARTHVRISIEEYEALRHQEAE